jgi:hypothetical protein
MCVRVGYKFRPCKRPSSGHLLENNSIKSKTYEMLAHYGIPCSFTKLVMDKNRKKQIYITNFVKPHGIPHCASISYVLDLIELFSNRWPDDGLLKGRNM